MRQSREPTEHVSDLKFRGRELLARRESASKLYCGGCFLVWLKRLGEFVSLDRGGQKICLFEIPVDYTIESVLASWSFSYVWLRTIMIPFSLYFAVGCSMRNI